MAETLVSPGVLARENDQSFITEQPVQAGAAIVGPTVKGPIEIPTIVTSYSDFQNRFGTTFESGSNEYSFFTSIAAQNYFNNGGNTLLVTRVVSGSATTDWDYAEASVLGNDDSTTAFKLESLYKGAEFTNSGSVTTMSNGALVSGSKDNFRWEVTTANTSSGTFSLIIRRGDDNTNTKSVLETFTNLSLDPKQSNYVARIIGDQKLNYNSTENYIEYSGSYPNASRYVRVKEVTNTPDYLDNTGTAKNAFTGSIPAVGSGSYGGSFSGSKGTNIPTSSMNMYHNINSTNSQGLKGSDYNNMLTLLSNQDEYRYNLLLLPGLTNSDHTSQITTAISNAESRGDNMVVVDPVNYGSTLVNATTEAGGRDTSYAAMYWPWVTTLDPDTGNQVKVPASTLMGGVFAFNDNAGEPWFAPAGINRGGMGTVIRAERKLSQANRDSLYEGNVNPIATFPGTGVVVYGQKTLQKQASALDRVNVRRLLIELKSYISQVSQTLVFEQNTAATRNNFLSQVNPYLESVQQRQGLYAFRVIMDDTNNTADVIDRNQLVGQIFIQPTRTAEFIYLDFNVLPTGATFPS
jgi:phage tail sheath protein FI